MGSSEEHSRLICETLLTLGRKCPQVGRFWRNETGMGLNIRTDEFFKYGLVGSADILGIVAPGKFIGLECKTGHAKQSKEQVNFQKMIERFGGLYLVVRSPQEAVDFVVANSAI
jgi:hypothetical protein